METKRINSCFTLVEIMVVVAIIALLFALYPSDWKEIRNDSRIKECAMQMEATAMGIKMFQLASGHLPEAIRVDGNDVPASTDTSLTTEERVQAVKKYLPKDIVFGEETPIGGKWVYFYNPLLPNKAWIQIKGHNLSDDERIRLDTIVDDGDKNNVGALTWWGNKIQFQFAGELPTTH